MEEGRLEHRVGATIAGRLETPDMTVSERVMIENVSKRGARVITEREWNPRAQVTLVDIIGGFHVDAEVVYCQRVSPNLRAIGLRFMSEAYWGVMPPRS
jgi:hypothetical protein